MADRLRRHHMQFHAVARLASIKPVCKTRPDYLCTSRNGFAIGYMLGDIEILFPAQISAKLLNN
jgi:hypothetical protein